jgi:hypothetical protein
MAPVPERLCQSYHYNDMRLFKYQNHGEYFRHIRRKIYMYRNFTHIFIVDVSENYFSKSRPLAIQ